MKKFKCHKIVQAAKITGTEVAMQDVINPLGQLVITLDDGTKKVLQPAQRFAVANIGDYFVVYDDGYESISPAKAFEEGYTEIVESPGPDDAPRCIDCTRKLGADKDGKVIGEYGYAGGLKEKQRSIVESAPVGTFGYALLMLKHGHAIARASWNGKRMFVYMVPANAYPAQTDIAKARFGEGLVPYNAYMALVGTDGRVSTWVPSSTDVLAEDWAVYSVDSVAHDWAHSTAPEQSAGDKFMDNMIQLGQLKRDLHGVGVPVDKIIADMNKCDDDILEARLQALGKDAPRVTPDQLKEVIFDAHYFTAFEGVYGAAVVRGTIPSFTPGLPHQGVRALELLTFCVLTLRNGFTVTGTSACVSQENFDSETGRDIAYKDALRQVWPLEGYLLKEELHRRAKFDAEPKTGVEDLYKNDDGVAEKMEAVRKSIKQYAVYRPLSEPTIGGIDPILGAVVQAWCIPENAHKVMDENLVVAIVKNVKAELGL